MNKRSAMVVAAGLVAALLAGGVALSFSLAGGTAAAQDGGRVKPIVKTERRTVTIHKKAEAKPAEVVTISTSASGSASATTGSDDAFEAERESEHDDDAFEHDAFDDHSGSQDSSDDSDSHESGGDD
jgi:hypothetical protein